MTISVTHAASVTQARKIPPPSEPNDLGTTGLRPPSGRWRQPDPQPTRGAAGPVHWFQRPPPEDSDADLWAAVQRIQARRMQLGWTVRELARRSAAAGWPLRRETLSRVLNGKQPTTWATARRLAEVVGIDIDRP